MQKSDTAAEQSLNIIAVSIQMLRFSRTHLRLNFPQKHAQGGLHINDHSQLLLMGFEDVAL